MAAPFRFAVASSRCTGPTRTPWPPGRFYRGAEVTRSPSSGLSLRTRSKTERSAIFVTSALALSLIHIYHAVYVSLPCPSPGYIWPAAQSDGQCSTGPLDGERIWLDLSDKQISRLPAKHWEKVLLHEMHHYGLMVVDSESNAPGSEPWNLYGIDNETMTLWGKPAPWTSFFSMVTKEGDGNMLDYADNASHLSLIHI